MPHDNETHFNNRNHTGAIEDTHTVASRPQHTTMIPGNAPYPGVRMPMSTIPSHQPEFARYSDNFQGSASIAQPTLPPPPPMPMPFRQHVAPFSASVSAVPKTRHPNRPPCTTPSKTLYIRNINEKIKIPALTKALHALFETYGELLEVRARTSIRMRGQAFIIFKEEEDAVKAHREVQGFVLFGKPMFIEFARVSSDASILDEGGDVDEHKKQRLEAKANKEQMAEQAQALSIDGSSRYLGTQPQFTGATVLNKILFLQNLPSDIKVAEIEDLFKPCPGFIEVRWVSVKPDVAFVEFESDLQAGNALSSLGSVWTPRDDDKPVQISFAKR